MISWKFICVVGASSVKGVSAADGVGVGVGSVSTGAGDASVGEGAASDAGGSDAVGDGEIEGEGEGSSEGVAVSEGVTDSVGAESDGEGEGLIDLLIAVHPVKIMINASARHSAAVVFLFILCIVLPGISTWHNAIVYPEKRSDFLPGQGFLLPAVFYHTARYFYPFLIF
jgi:hypothetical protein